MIRNNVLNIFTEVIYPTTSFIKQGIILFQVIKIELKQILFLLFLLLIIYFICKKEI